MKKSTILYFGLALATGTVIGCKERANVDQSGNAHARGQTQRGQETVDVVRDVVDSPALGLQSDAAHKEAEEIGTKLRIGTNLPKKFVPLSESEIAVSCMSGTLGNGVFIRGITDHDAQDEIVNKLRNLKAEEDWRWIYVEFEDRRVTIEESEAGQEAIVVYSVIIE